MLLLMVFGACSQGMPNVSEAGAACDESSAATDCFSESKSTLAESNCGLTVLTESSTDAERKALLSELGDTTGDIKTQLENLDNYLRDLLEPPGTASNEQVFALHCDETLVAAGSSHLSASQVELNELADFQARRCTRYDLSLAVEAFEPTQRRKLIPFGPVLTNLIGSSARHAGVLIAAAFRELSRAALQEPNGQEIRAIHLHIDPESTFHQAASYVQPKCMSPTSTVEKFIEEDTAVRPPPYWVHTVETDDYARAASAMESGISLLPL